MTNVSKMALDDAMAWCTLVVGCSEVLSDHSRTHGGHASSMHRLRLADKFCYLKVHDSLEHWGNEVHAYEHWSRAFGGRAPQLLAVHDEPPFALVISELPGWVLEQTQLSPSQERAVWRSAGEALLALHEWQSGTFFGRCSRDGSPAEGAAATAVEYVSRTFNEQMQRAIVSGHITAEERAVLQSVADLIPAFEGEPAIPCHRDYCAANWLVDADGAWTGVIDFEFSHWDVRVADFSRDPHWAWIHRPDLFGALLEGYGRCLTLREERQLRVARAAYALSAIVWGRDHAFYGFEQEGRAALAYLAASAG